jgi:pSer/pThr/pTyr-binding forkhead associated (FHA) protein
VLIIGTRDDADVRLVSESVSGLHAMIIRSSGGSLLRDLASRTGTRVDGRVVRETELRDGSELLVGAVRIRLKIAPSAAVACARPASAALVPLQNGSGPVPVASRTVLVGRHQDCDLILSDDSVSLVHAILFEFEGSHLIRDFNSPAATMVNGEAVSQRALVFGDIIRIGHNDFRYAPADGGVDPVSKLRPRIGRKARHASVAPTPLATADEEMNLPEHAGDPSPESAEPTATPKSTLRRDLTALVVSLLIACVAAALGAAAWWLASPRLLIEANYHVAADMAATLDLQKLQRDLEVTLRSGSARAAAIDDLRRRGSVQPGFLDEPLAADAHQIALRWEDRGTPPRSELVVRFIGHDDDDLPRFAALAQAALGDPAQAPRLSDVERLRQTLAETDHANLEQEEIYLLRRVAELRDQLKLEELSAPSPSQVAALAQRAATARAEHHAALSARIRNEMKPAPDGAGADNDRPVKSNLLETETKLAQRTQDAEKQLRQAQAQLDGVASRREELQSAELRLGALKAKLRQSAAAHDGQDVAASQLQALRLDGIRVIEREDRRGLWAMGASMLVFVALTTLAMTSRRIASRIDRPEVSELS